MDRYKFSRFLQWTIHFRRVPDDYIKKMIAQKHNNDYYVRWVLKVLKPYGQKEGYKQNACSLHMHPDNVRYLYKYLSPMVYLNYAPVEDESVALNETVVDRDKVFEYSF